MARLIGIVLLVLALLPKPVAAAQATWLDSPTPANWNSVGAPIPTAPPPPDEPDPRALAANRWAETAEDEAVSAEGWYLYTAYEAGWGLKLVYGTSDYDGMGRPWGYQVFVFANGVYAGSLAPDPMNARADGSLTQVFINGDQLTAQFARYTATDPLCCPSKTSIVTYRVSFDDPAGPLVEPVSVS